MPKQKQTPIPPAPLRSFRSTFPTLVYFMRKLNYVEGKEWPAPDDLVVLINDMCQTKPELMNKALTLYERGYEHASNKSFRMAIYQFYAALCELPPYKVAFPTDNHLWAGLGSPTGSLWPTSETVQGQIESKSTVNIQTLQRAIDVYAKAHASLGSGSCGDVISRIHKILCEA